MVPTVGLKPRTEDLTRLATLRLNHSATPPLDVVGFSLIDDVSFDLLQQGSSLRNMSASEVKNRT